MTDKEKIQKAIDIAIEWGGFEQINNYTIDFKFCNPVDAESRFINYANRLEIE